MTTRQVRARAHSAKSFNGFPAEGMKFLKRLKRNNERNWFVPRNSSVTRFKRCCRSCGG